MVYDSVEWYGGDDMRWNEMEGDCMGWYEMVWDGMRLYAMV